jgi:hypothetical protein
VGEQKEHGCSYREEMRRRGGGRGGAKEWASFITRKQCGDAGVIMPRFLRNGRGKKSWGAKTTKTLAIHGKFSDGGIFTRGVDSLAHSISQSLSHSLI